jgi:acyl-CoA synthetase (AMP-forming)/AMP-acid ligase II
VDAVSRQRLSFAQVKEHATHLCTALVKRYDFQEGDTVSIFSYNTIWYPVGMFAVLRAGGRVNGASPAYTAAEMSHALRTAGTKWIMTVPDSIGVAVAAAREAGIPKERIFLLDGKLESFTTVQELIQIGKIYGNRGQSPFFRVPDGQTNDICGYLTFSSGTTGLPKAVSSSYSAAIWGIQSSNMRALGDALAQECHRAMSPAQSRSRTREEDVSGQPATIPQ